MKGFNLGSVLLLVVALICFRMAYDAFGDVSFGTLGVFSVFKEALRMVQQLPEALKELSSLGSSL